MYVCIIHDCISPSSTLHSPRHAPRVSAKLFVGAFKPGTADRDRVTVEQTLTGSN